MKTAKTKTPNPTFKKDGPYLGLTEEEFKILRRAAQSTLETIAYDIPGNYTRKAIVEVVFDADYLYFYGKENNEAKKLGYKNWSEFYEKRLNPWISKCYHAPAFQELMKKVFLCDRYSL